MGKMELPDSVVEYKDDDGTKQAVFDLVLEYCRHCEVFSGASIYGNGHAIMHAKDLVMEIVDVLCCTETLSAEFRGRLDVAPDSKHN